MNYNPKLRLRILLGYLAPLALMVAVSAAVFWSTQNASLFAESLERAYLTMNNIKEVHLRGSEAFRAAQEYLLFKNEVSRNLYQNASGQFRDKLALVGKQVSDPVQKQNFAKVNAGAARLGEFTARQVELVDAKQAQKATELFRTGAGVDLMRDLNSQIVEFENREAEIVAVQMRAVHEALDGLVVLVIAATLLAVLAALALALWLANRIGRPISDSVNVLASAATEIAATVDEHERTVSQQSTAVSETTTTVEELGMSARQSAGQAESSAAAAKQALDLTQAGSTAARQASESMLVMKQRIGSVAEQILRLSEQAGQIGGIARSMGELAGETNMLALNAAVEAARVGEQGKGFAVVAMEVRKLAEQSRKSAERANELVAQIQKATNSAVMVTEEGSRTAEEVSEIAQNMAASFGSIAEAVGGVSVNSQQVMLNSKQQATALTQVTEAMQSLSGGAKQMAAGTEQTKAGVLKLNEVALGLQAMV